MLSFKHPDIQIIKYNKLDTIKKEHSYDIIESNKAFNIHNICSIIKEIIDKYDEPVHISMEGVSYGSVGSAALVDLSGLNFAIRNTLIDANASFTIVSPSQNKKFATGNGSADKELMVFSWLKIEKHLVNIKDIKIDDLADAFFLCHYTNKV
jgi:Holliday junction resolvasome RuvABC endonuclease subunit